MKKGKSKSSDSPLSFQIFFVYLMGFSRLICWFSWQKPELFTSMNSMFVIHEKATTQNSMVCPDTILWYMSFAKNNWTLAVPLADRTSRQWRKGKFHTQEPRDIRFSVQGSPQDCDKQPSSPLDPHKNCPIDRTAYHLQSNFYPCQSHCLL